MSFVLARTHCLVNQKMQLRSICTSVFKCKQFNAQFGKAMAKVMTFDITKKTRLKIGEKPTPYVKIASGNAIGKNPSVTLQKRRVTVLNKIFMSHICELMATGTVAEQLLGRGIEITHVKVAPDFRVVNVFWHAKKNSNVSESTEKLLQTAAGHLQHELTQLRVIGIVPPINFVRNRYIGATAEVEERLAEVDFGEDFVPNAHLSKNKSPILETSLEPEIKAKLTEVDRSTIDPEDESLYDIQIPEMEHCVMGFNHETIMKKLKISLSKAKLARERQSLEEKIENTESESNHLSVDALPTMINLLSRSEENQLFDNFLKQRASQERRKNRANRIELKLEEEKERMLRASEQYSTSNEVDYEEEYRDEYEDIENAK
ncbi:hypothetical protein TKK_0004291 [Trichogramma kaykai]